jgi:hypothetical protein
MTSEIFTRRGNFEKAVFSLSIILQKTLRYRTHVFHLFFFPSFFTLFSFLIAMFTYSIKRRKIIWFIISPTRIKGVNHNMLNFWTSNPWRGKITWTWWWKFWMEFFFVAILNSGKLFVSILPNKQWKFLFKNIVNSRKMRKKVMRLKGFI